MIFEETEDLEILSRMWDAHAVESWQSIQRLDAPEAFRKISAKIAKLQEKLDAMYVECRTIDGQIGRARRELQRIENKHSRVLMLAQEEEILAERVSHWKKQAEAIEKYCLDRQYDLARREKKLEERVKDFQRIIEEQGA